MRNTGMLFYGEGNLLEHALDKAASLLNTTRDKLSANPDYLFVDYDEGKSSIGVESAARIVEKSSLLASFNDFQVCVVNHMESMTQAAQNKILKTLEESAMIVIGVCYEDGILPTVKSRMQKIHIADKKEIPADVEGIFEKISSALVSSPVDVLRHLNLVKEKDPESFYQAHRDYVGDLLTLIGNTCSSNLSREVVLRLADMRENCMSSSFTKDDFFVLLATIVCDLKKGETNVTI